MISPLCAEQMAMYRDACLNEHVFGSRAWASLLLYGLEHPRHKFYLSTDPAGRVDAALHLNGDVLSIVPDGGPILSELADFVRRCGATEIDSSEEQDVQLQKLLGGEIESSYFMEYPLSQPPALDPSWDIRPTQDARAVFDVLRQSHEYYRDHLEYGPWAEDLQARWQKQLATTVLLYQGGCAVGTGSVISTDDQAGAVAAVAVIPQARHKGCGAAISAWLTGHILAQGKKPVLISGYDEVAQLYRGLGYRETGRWGELYL